MGLFAGSLLIVGQALTAPTAEASLRVCPESGFSNTTINGGVVVAAGTYCLLDNVTINGSLIVHGQGDLEGSAVVYAGVRVRPGGELEVGVSLFGGTTSDVTIYSGLSFRNPVDWDIETAHIYGGVTINHYTAPFPEASPTFCGNTLYGGMTVGNASATITWIGDPGERLGGALRCKRNKIHGSLSISDSSTFVVEGNRVSGSVYLDASTIELNGNRIGGSLVCTGGTVILPPESSDDPSGNTVAGTTTC
jgi:uncharacterized Zn-binding protein involved in type VI secretion